MIGAAVIIGKDAVSDTKVGRIADDENKYGEKLNNELRQNETENKLSVSPVTNVADNRKQQLRRNGRNIVAAAETNMENITETTGRPETQTENTNTQTKPVLPETVAEEFKIYMISGHHRLQEVRAKLAARRKTVRKTNSRTAVDDIALIRVYEPVLPGRWLSAVRQNFSAERMMLLQAMQRC